MEKYFRVAAKHSHFERSEEDMKRPRFRFQKRIAQQHIDSVIAGIAAPSGSWEVAQIQRELGNSSHVITAWSGSELIGFASASSQGAAVSLSWLFVRPDWQRKGIGKELVSELLARFPDVTNASAVANQAAAPFYRSCGFEPAPHVVPMTKTLKD